MWPIKSAVVPYLAAFLVVVLGVASYGSYRTGYKVGRADGDRQVLKMQQAGVAALAKSRETVQELKGKSREDAIRIARLSRNARVFVCPEPGLPASGDGADASSPGDGRAVREDLAPVLRQCLRTFGEVNRALAQ